MARRLRVQYERALYHVINRGNYQHDVFGTVGAAQAFETTLAETSERYGWNIHAYVVMRNHYHLAVETPRANLTDGMHWLQSTYATRFNRFRVAHGHLFQGRYQALLIEDAHALARVVNYIHLNPVRANLIAVGEVGRFRWSTLRQFVGGAARPSWLSCTDWLAALGFQDSRSDWRLYVDFLIELSGDPERQQKDGFAQMTRGWAIGTAGWRKALAQDHAHLALSPAIPAKEAADITEAKLRTILELALLRAGKTPSDAAVDMKSARWKIEMAAYLRQHAAARYRWIADVLNMGEPASVRVYVRRYRLTS